MDPVESLADELFELAGVSLAHETLDDALDAICQVAARAVRSADGASLTTFGASGSEAAAASDPWAALLDELQYAEHEGPCLDGARSGVIFRIRDFDREVRWPSYTPRAIEAGARSMISIPMTVEAKVIGALNVYSREVDAFDAEDVSVAEIVAGHASLAAQVAATLQGHRVLGEQLQRAMASRATIEQAKGILMATTGCDAEAAFARLVEQSSLENRKLRDIAADLVRQASRVRLD